MKTIETIVIVTGGFDPIHSGHIRYLNKARELGDYLVVGLNSDEWLSRKKGRAFMPWEERRTILDAVGANLVIAFDDKDGTAIDVINQVKNRFPDKKIIFANGGDRTANNVPETSVADVEFVFGVGGGKTASSSDFLQRWLDTSSKAA